MYDNFYTIPQTKKDVEGITLEEFRSACLYFGIKADTIDLELLMTKYQDTKKMKEVFVDFDGFYNLFYPLSREELF